jgi:putative transposase
LDPTASQIALLRKHIGAARWTYNWGLAQKLDLYRLGQPAPNWMALSVQLNARKQLDYPWLYEVSKSASMEPLRDLDRAFAAFFRTRGARQRRGLPRFKRKRAGGGSCRFRGVIHVTERSVQLPRLGKIRLKERGYIPTDGKVLSATVKLHAGRWYVSVSVESTIQVPVNHGPAVGIDLGLAKFASVSDGTVFESYRPLGREVARIRRADKNLAAKRLGSANRRKAELKLAKIHQRIANRRQDFIHKITSQLARTKSVIVIERLNVSGLSRNRALAQRFQDSAFREFRRQLEYKTVWSGGRLILAPNFYPSTRTCSACGFLGEAIPLSQRLFKCSRCALTIDRDLNAARNLLAVAASSADTQNACRVNISPLKQWQFTMKQEPPEPQLWLESENGETVDILVRQGGES